MKNKNCIDFKLLSTLVPLFTFIILLTGKLSIVSDLPWIFVFSPIYIPIIGVIFVLLVSFILYAKQRSW